MKPQKTNAMRILEKDKIPYEMRTYEADEHIDGLSVAKKIGQDPAHLYKTIVLKGEQGYAVALVAVDQELDLKKAAKALSMKRVELIPVNDLFSISGYIRGGCSPIGMKKSYPTVIDRRILDQDRVFVSGGKIGLQILIRPQDLIQATKAKVEDLL